jgi:hypothetical protein
VRVKEVKVDFSDLYFPNAKECIDGSMGIAIEKAMEEQGFKISKGTIDIEEYQLEIKTRKKSSSSPHTVGTMTLKDIIDTPWDQTPFKQKLQNQFRVTIDDEIGRVCDQRVVHLSDDPDIQKELEKSYENARTILTERYNATGQIPKGTIKNSDDIGLLEHRSGSQYAYRITDSGMKRFINMANTAPVFNSLFSYS